MLGEELAHAVVSEMCLLTQSLLYMNMNPKQTESLFFIFLKTSFLWRLHQSCRFVRSCYNLWQTSSLLSGWDSLLSGLQKKNLHSVMWDSGRQSGKVKTSYWIHNDTWINHPPLYCMFFSPFFIIFVSVWIRVWGKDGQLWCQVAQLTNNSSYSQRLWTFISQFLCAMPLSLTSVHPHLFLSAAKVQISLDIKMIKLQIFKLSI